MPSQKLTAQDALDLAQRFQDLATKVADYRFANWSSLTPAQRQALESQQWSLMNSSSDMVTVAVGIVLDTSITTIQAIQRATDRAKAVLKKIETAKKVIRVAAAAVGLGAAIASKDPGAIAKNAAAVIDAAKSDTA